MSDFFTKLHLLDNWWWVCVCILRYPHWDWTCLGCRRGEKSNPVGSSYLVYHLRHLQLVLSLVIHLSSSTGVLGIPYGLNSVHEVWNKEISSPSLSLTPALSVFVYLFSLLNIHCIVTHPLSSHYSTCYCSLQARSIKYNKKGFIIVKLQLLL